VTNQQPSSPFSSETFKTYWSLKPVLKSSNFHKRTDKQVYFNKKSEEREKESLCVHLATFIKQKNITLREEGKTR